MRLKQEYTQTLRMALRQKLNQSYLMFLLSADNLNNAIRRWQYIRQYQRYRKRQAFLIAETQSTLQVKTTQLKQRIREKENLLNGVEQQKQTLSVELQDKDLALKNLKADEKVLLKELTDRQKAHNKLNGIIENVIQQEMLAQRKKARSAEALNNANLAVNNSNKPDRTPKTGTTESDNLLPSSEDLAASATFSARKGRLSWPVDQGRIVQDFGTFQHPKYKDVKVSNSGLDIGTLAAGKVRAVFEGKVVGAQFINGYQYTVIIQHGNFYTVYSNIASINIKRGESVTTGQEIGQVGTERPEMHFEVWRDKQKLNPASWLERR